MSVSSAEQVQEASERYEKVLKESFVAVEESLKVLKAGGDPDVDLLDDLRKRLVLGTVEIVREKNRQRLALHELDELYVDKVRRLGRQYNSVKLASLKRSELAKDGLLEQSRQASSKIRPDSDAHLAMLYTNDEIAGSGLLTKLDTPAGKIEGVITAEEIAQFEQDSQRQVRERAKLVELNDRYYDKEGKRLQREKARWEQKLARAVKFVSQDAEEMRRFASAS